MRRTSATKLLCPVDEDRPWSTIPCDACKAMGITIAALSVNGNGATEVGFCGTRCATLRGWPWLRSERDSKPVAGQASLFESHSI